ncbi:MAG TPA: ATP-binding cassette domain-containing protein, partial [Gaiellales bacterium]
FQWSTTSREVKDGRADHITREPEQVKAFRDTWRDGIHSYLTYLRDRLTVARDLLSHSGSIFVQIGDENVHLVRSVLDEVFGSENFCSLITFKTTSGAGSFAGGTLVVPAVSSYVLWYAQDINRLKYRQLYKVREVGGAGGGQYTWLETDDGARRRASPEELMADPPAGRIFQPGPLTSQTTRVGQTTVFPVEVDGETFVPGKGGWKTNAVGMKRLKDADRLMPIGNTLRFIRYFDDSARFYGLTPRQTRTAIPEILRRVGFPPERRGEPMEDLSRGMQQKIALARALLTSPVLLLLDEPTTGLDPRSKLEVQELVRDMRRRHDCTILLCTHDMTEAEALADRVGILHEGGLLALDTSSEVRERYGAETLEDAFMAATGRSFEDEAEEEVHA